MNVYPSLGPKAHPLDEDAPPTCTAGKIGGNARAGGRTAAAGGGGAAGGNGGPSRSRRGTPMTIARFCSFQNLVSARWRRRAST